MKMKAIRKSIFRVGAIAGWVFLIWIGGCAVLSGFPWGEKEEGRITSPDGRHDAVVIWHETPPLTMNRMSLCLTPHGAPHERKNTVLRARYIRTQDVAWVSSQNLVVTQPGDLDVLHFKPYWPSCLQQPIRLKTSENPRRIRIDLKINYETVPNHEMHGTQ